MNKILLSTLSLGILLISSCSDSEEKSEKKQIDLDPCECASEVKKVEDMFPGEMSERDIKDETLRANWKFCMGKYFGRNRDDEFAAKMDECQRSLEDNE